VSLFSARQSQPGEGHAQSTFLIFSVLQITHAFASSRHKGRQMWLATSDDQEAVSKLMISNRMSTVNRSRP
jgi:hypothetical protein